MIDAVYINDDCSNDGSVEIYNDRRVREYFSPWKLNVRVNTRNVHISQVYVPGYRVDYMDWKFMLTKWHRFIDPRVPHNRHDIRYQYALDNTDKKYLLIIHDDVKFVKDVVSLYLKAFADNPNLAVAGDFGQCWRCRFAAVCSPKKIMSGFRPSRWWPLTPTSGEPADFNPANGYTRACRINEWCCMVDVEKCRDVTERKRCFLGNMYKYSDTTAFWFGKWLNAVTILSIRFRPRLCPNSWRAVPNTKSIIFTPGRGTPAIRSGPTREWAS